MHVPPNDFTASGFALSSEPRVSNPVLRLYLEVYAARERDFYDQVKQFGLSFARYAHDPSFAVPSDCACGRSGSFDTSIPCLAGVHIENDRKSFWLGWISPACLTCRKGVGTSTFLISTQCPRDCWFCFNPNQMDFDRLQYETCDAAAELEVDHARGIRYVDLALTGGEPLMHKDQTLQFFARARELYPNAYARLYTSGSFLDEETLVRLRDIGLNEIRFSIKTDDAPAQQETTFDRIEKSCHYIENVMVEMPVMPDQIRVMKVLLRRLDALAVRGINLLELCFPLHNASAFASRGYKIKNPPMRVLYDYWYAGGLPIAGSEEACLELLGFAAREQLAMGVHYCSLENKLSGQIYLQNKVCPADGLRQMSPKDYYLKSAKAFGSDARLVVAVLAQHGVTVAESSDGSYVEFPIAAIMHLRTMLPHVELGIAYYVAEQAEGGGYSLKELALKLTTPTTFDLARDF